MISFLKICFDIFQTHCTNPLDITLSMDWDVINDTSYIVFIFIFLGFVMIPIFIWLWEIIGRYFWNVVVKPLELIIKYIKELNILISQDITKVQTIDEILNKIQVTYILLLTLQKIWKISLYINNLLTKAGSAWCSLLQPEYLVILPELIYQNINWISQVLINLRSDLSIRLAEQQNLLESAKWDVEKIEQTPLPPLSGGLETWLMQVSELQKSRLDKQIKQFEELQRVLVKV